MNKYTFTSFNYVTKSKYGWDAKCHLVLDVNGLTREFIIERETPIPKYYWMSLLDLLINRLSNDLNYGTEFKSMAMAILYDKHVYIEGNSDIITNMFNLDPNDATFIDNNLIPIVNFIDECIDKSKATNKYIYNKFSEKYMMWNETK